MVAFALALAGGVLGAVQRAWATVLVAGAVIALTVHRVF